MALQGSTVISGSADKTVKVWALETGQCVHTLEGHSGYVYSVALPNPFPPVNTMYAFIICVQLRLQLVQEGHVWCICQRMFEFAGNTRVIVSGSHDKTVRIWDLDAATSTASSFAPKVGSRVDARWETGSVFFAGTAAGVREGLCDVVFDDGDERKGVPFAEVRKCTLVKTLEGGHTHSVAVQGSTIVSGSCSTVRVWTIF